MIISEFFEKSDFRAYAGKIVRALAVPDLKGKPRSFFDKVEAELIHPALDDACVSDGTTGEPVQLDNIRTDMIEQLLIADLVIADISVHNANCFYELGTRHVFRDKRTFLIRSKGDEVPFVLKTDRYLPYEASGPGGTEDMEKRAQELTGKQG